MSKGLLPLPVVIALLRLLRRKPVGADDEDVLFDEFTAVGDEQVLAKARARLLNDGADARTLSGTNGYTERTVDHELANARLDALLVDMLRSHHRQRAQEAA